ncbi:hypothetical protein BKA61DRAFT_103318 [Leptodontidium sp. MPI-SDFR-AT-0119]|nr:hypothetical protein BKA61DRAFT_103318 [Leptodontidium sp. MPI-SDFR-AT-0119]
MATYHCGELLFPPHHCHDQFLAHFISCNNQAFTHSSQLEYSLLQMPTSTMPPQRKALFVPTPEDIKRNQRRLDAGLPPLYREATRADGKGDATPHTKPDYKWVCPQCYRCWREEHNLQNHFMWEHNLALQKGMAVPNWQTVPDGIPWMYDAPFPGPLAHHRPPGKFYTRFSEFPPNGIKRYPLPKGWVRPGKKNQAPGYDGIVGGTRLPGPSPFIDEIKRFFTSTPVVAANGRSYKGQFQEVHLGPNDDLEDSPSDDSDDDDGVGNDNVTGSCVPRPPVPADNLPPCADSWPIPREVSDEELNQLLPS